MESAVKELQDLLHWAMMSNQKIAQVIRFDVSDIAASTAWTLAKKENAVRLFTIMERVLRELDEEARE